MNTPRTKPPKRYTFPDLSATNLRNGHFALGLTSAPHLQAVGAVTTSWTRLEEVMIDVMASLMGHEITTAPARQVFRSIVSTDLRVKVMRTLLQEAQINATKSAFYDEVLDEFASINRARNNYVHGLWTTSVNEGTVFLEETTTSDNHPFLFAKPRVIKVGEIEGIAERIWSLTQRVLLELRPEHEKSVPPGLRRAPPAPDPQAISAAQKPRRKRPARQPRPQSSQA